MTWYNAAGNQLYPYTQINDVLVPLFEQAVETSWETLFAARDFAGLDTWYANNTGHTSPPTATYGDFVMDTDWLNAHLGQGNVTQANGRWIVQNIKAIKIRIDVNNLTIKNSLIESNGNAGIANYYGVNPTGIIIEQCTLNGQNADWIGIAFSEATEINQITVKRCDISGYRVGIQIIGGMLAEENWAHDMYYDDVDPHVTSMSIRARNVRLYRNRLSDGNSAGLAFYNETTPYTNIVAEQNIINAEGAYWEVAYLGSYAPGANTVRFINNLLRRGALAGSSNFSEVSGNKNQAGDIVN